MTRDDAEIVHAVLQGDVETFRLLVERHQDSVFRIALRTTAREESASEIAQEAFVRAFEKLSALKDPAYFYGWLRQITIRLCMDWLRARNGHPKSLDSLEEKGVEPGFERSQPRSSPVEQEAHLHSVQEIVLREMDALSTNDQRLLMLRYFEGLSVAQIAHIEGIKTNTAKVKLFRAREALRPRLQKLYTQGDLTCEGLSSLTR